MIVIIINAGQVLVFVAGASLIAPGVAMTGAHKVQQYTGSWGELVVRCGEWDTQTESEPLKHQDRCLTNPDPLTNHAPSFSPQECELGRDPPGVQPQEPAEHDRPPLPGDGVRAGQPRGHHLPAPLQAELRRQAALLRQGGDSCR